MSIITSHSVKKLGETAACALLPRSITREQRRFESQLGSTKKKLPETQPTITGVHSDFCISSLDEPNVGVSVTGRPKKLRKCVQSSDKPDDFLGKLEQAWAMLQVPIIEKLDFVLKYSESDNALQLPEIVPQLLDVAHNVLAREQLLESLRWVQRKVLVFHTFFDYWLFSIRMATTRFPKNLSLPSKCQSLKIYATGSNQWSAFLVILGFKVCSTW